MRGDRDRLLDMIEMCEFLTQYASNRSQLESDPVVHAATQRWIEVLGEAASHVSTELRQRHPEVPWREIIGTRVILAHAYFHIDRNVIGDVVDRHIPDLSRRLRTIYNSLTEE